MSRRFAAVALAIALGTPLVGCMEVAALDMIQEGVGAPEPASPPAPDPSSNETDPDLSPVAK